MKLFGTVKGIRVEDGLGDHDWHVVTVDLWGSKLELRLKPHDARGYQLGRTVDLVVTPRELPRRRRRKAVRP